MADDLDGFLKGNTEPDPVEELLGPGNKSAPDPAPEPPKDAAPEPQPEREREREPEAEADAGEGPIHRDVLRRVREDWKAKTIKAETEAAELRRQLDEMKRAPPQPQQQPEPPQFIDPREDPAGFIQRTQQVMISNRLDVSEMMLRKELGADTVEKVKTEFKKAADANPALYHELYKQPDPYAWAHQQVQAMEFQREINGDPNAYREKLRAELMAEIQGQQAPQQPQRPAVPQQAPSLARANSAAPRSSVPFTGPPALEDVLGRR